MAAKDIIFLVTISLFVLCIRSNLEVIRERQGTVVVCYFGVNSIISLAGDNLYLCSHLILDSGYINPSTYTMHLADMVNSDYVTSYKKNNSHLKITMGVNIWSELDEFRPADHETERSKLIRTAVDLVRDNSFDGLDLIVTKFPETDENLEALIYFVQKLKEEFLRHNYIVTASIPRGANDMIKITKKLVALSHFLDLIQLSTANRYTSQRINQQVIAPLKSSDESDSSSIEFFIKHLLAHGLKPVKLVLLLHMNIYPYLITDPDIEDVKLKDLVVIKSTSYGLYAMCMEETAPPNETRWVYHWSEEVSAPYLRNDDRIVFYDNPRSVANQVQLGIEYGVRGFSLWTMRSYQHNFCKIPNDTYLDFVERYSKLKEDPYLLEKLKDLNLPTADPEGELDGKSYRVLNNTLVFRVPELKLKTQSHLRIVNQAIALSLEEKKILDALKINNKKSYQPYCIFWPKCTAPIPLPNRIASGKR